MPSPVGYLDSLCDLTPPVAGPLPTFYPDRRTDSLRPKLSGYEGMAAAYTKEGAAIAGDRQDAIDRWAVQFLQTENGLGVFDLHLKATLARAAYWEDAAIIDGVRAAVEADGYESVLNPDPLIPSVWCYWWRNVGAIIGVEGTSNYHQWINYVYSSDSVPAVAPDGTLYGRSLSAFQATALACVPAAAALLRAHVGRNQVYQLVGHSLGGVMAHMLGRYLPAVVGFRPLLCTTFGSPRTGDPAYRTASRHPKTVRVVHEPDPVTQLPPAYCTRYGLLPPPVPMRYTHPIADRVGLTVDGEYYLAGQGEGDEAGGTVAFQGLSTIGTAVDRHVLAVYCRRLQDLMERYFPDLSEQPMPLALSTLNETLSRAGG